MFPRPSKALTKSPSVFPGASRNLGLFPESWGGICGTKAAANREGSKQARWVMPPDNLVSPKPGKGTASWGVWFWDAFGSVCSLKNLWKILFWVLWKDLDLSVILDCSWVVGLFRSEQAGGSCGDSELKTAKELRLLEGSASCGYFDGMKEGGGLRFWNNPQTNFSSGSCSIVMMKLEWELLLLLLLGVSEVAMQIDRYGVTSNASGDVYGRSHDAITIS